MRDQRETGPYLGPRAATDARDGDGTWERRQREARMEREKFKGATPGPWHVQRRDQEDGTITYEIWNDQVDRVLTINDDGNPRAKADAEMIVALRNDLPAPAARDHRRENRDNQKPEDDLR